MKKTACIFLTLLMLLSLLCGCSRLSTADSIIGTWRSEDGFTVTFDNVYMTLRDAEGSTVSGFPAQYVVAENILYLVEDGDAIPVFECRPDGRTLELVYTGSFMLQATGSVDSEKTIALVRCD